MNLTQWPTHRDGRRKPVQGVSIPFEWFDKFCDAVLWLKMNGYGENDSHVIVRAVIETVERMRKENG